MISSSEEPEPRNHAESGRASTRIGLLRAELRPVLHLQSVPLNQPEELADLIRLRLSADLLQVHELADLDGVSNEGASPVAPALYTPHADRGAPGATKAETSGCSAVYAVRDAGVPALAMDDEETDTATHETATRKT